MLLEKEHKPYLAEIIIDGYTDTDGDYAYNLELSQQRSLAVAQYLLDIQGEFLSNEEALDLQDYLTVNGHSMSNPVLDSDGNVDKDASRRVEVKFRLKDDEMIDELNKIMTDSQKKRQQKKKRMSKMESGCLDGQPFLEEFLIRFIYLRQVFYKVQGW